MSTDNTSAKVEKPKHGPYFQVLVVLVILAVLTICSYPAFSGAEISWGEAIKGTFRNLGIVFFQPKLNTFTFLEGIQQLFITLAMAYMTTFVSAIIGFFCGLVSSNAMRIPYVGPCINVLMSLIRSVPTVMWVLIFAIVVGLGSEAAVLGMLFHSVAYLSKMYAQSFDEMDQGVIEALRASGGNWLQIVGQGILPETLPSLISWTFMRFETNYIVALGMGASAGAGGLGYNLQMAGSYYYDMHEVGAITYYILIAAFLFEFISNRLQKAVTE